MKKQKRKYESHKSRMGNIARAQSQAGRDIGDIPPIADIKRRDRCRSSLQLFCTTYNPEAFSLPFAPDHLAEIRRIEEAVFQGALYAFAEPRGSGKTTRVRMATLWAISYGLARYVFVIGATDSKAVDTLASIKTFIRFLPDYAADFPEISHAANALAGIANRASGQLCNGSPTMIEWAADKIVLPTVPPPENWPKRKKGWKLRKDGMVPTSGAVIGVSGLTGEGIRGSLKTLTTGEQVRPDLVLIDDPQTSESARSKSQNEARYRLVMGDVLNMAGPGKALSCVMPCTVIARGDFIDRILDRKAHPLWRGERTKLLRSMPAKIEAWQDYFDVYQRCAMKEPPEFTEANEYYKGHRAELDEGAEASWPERKLEWEVSAIQHAMHLYCRDRAAFMAEYQNEPVEDQEEGTYHDLNADVLVERLNQVPRGAVPPGMSRLTAFADVQQNSIWWVVCAWSEGFAAGAVVDYGTFPDQSREWYTRYDLRPGLDDLQELRGEADKTGRIYYGLRVVTNNLLGKPYQVQDGGETRLDFMLVDSRYETSTVHQFCKESPHGARLMPSMGYGIGAAKLPMANWPVRDGERRGGVTPGSVGWVMRPHTAGGRGRQVVIDTNQMKTFLVQRLLTPMGGRGALTLFGSNPQAHRLFAAHLTSEYRVETEGHGRKLSEWVLKADRPDNDWFDALVGCVAAASVQGLVWSPSGAPVNTPRQKIKLSEIYARKQELKGKQ